MDANSKQPYITIHFSEKSRRFKRVNVIVRIHGECCTW